MKFSDHSFVDLSSFFFFFFDDILVYSANRGEHLTRLQMTLGILRTHKLYAKRTKCSFGQEQIKYLGHVTSQ